jgi:uncharacterized protein VirK/YbjX
MPSSLDLTPISFFEEILSRVESKRERWKLKIGKLFFPNQTQRWLRYVHSHPHLLSQVSQFPKLLTKIYRPYVSRKLNCHGRVEHLIGHYELVNKLNLTSLVAHASNQELVLANLQDKINQPIKVVLVAIRHGHREGELEFQLKWQDTNIYSMTCSLTTTTSGLALKVAKIQGSSEQKTKEAIKSATKACFGARPQTVLLSVAQDFGAALSCQEIILIGNQNRVSLNPLRRRKIKSNYDAIWLEHGSAPHQSGDYYLPGSTKQLFDLATVPSHKRSQYRKRNDMFEALQSQVRDCVQWHQREGVRGVRGAAGGRPAK